MTYFYINRMLKMGLCSYVGHHKTVKEILELAIIEGKKYCMVACQGLLLYRGPSLVQKSVAYAENNPQFFVIGLHGQTRRNSVQLKAFIPDYIDSNICKFR